MDIKSTIDNYGKLMIFELNFRDKNRILRSKVSWQAPIPNQYKNIYLIASLWVLVWIFSVIENSLFDKIAHSSFEEF